MHDEFFTEDYKSCGAVFTHERKILCEEFKVVYSLFEVVPFEEADARKLCDWKYQGEYAVYNYPGQKMRLTVRPFNKRAMSR